MDLTAENADSAWNSASSGTLGAWDFGDSTQLPALVFNDYDGASTGTDYSVLFARLTTLTALIPNQRPTTSPQIGTANTDIQLSSGGDTANRISGNIQLPATFNGENLTWSVFYDPAPSSTQISIDNNNGIQVTETHRQTERIVILRARDGSNNTIVNDYHLRIIAPNRIDPPALTAPSSPLLFATDRTVSRTVVGNSGTPDSCSIAGLPAGLTATVSGDGCVITGLARTATAQSTYTLTASNAVGTDTITISITVQTVVDRNNNGLIELYTLTQLHNMRYSLDGSRYKTSSTDTGNALGCPNDACIGYELMNDLDFDTDGDGTWTQSDSGNYRLNTNDSATPYFIVNAGGSGGWLPVGDSANAFNTIFEGNGYAIYNLAIRNGLANIGLFGVINANASIRNIGLVNNLSNYTGDRSSVVGGLVGQQNGGTISASYATGDAYGNRLGLVDIGGLVGSQEGGRIIASYATGNVNGGRNRSDTGGLVGQQNQVGSIIASYASGDARGGSSNSSNEYVGGLLGFQNGTISASYATGDVNGGDSNADYAGGLLGFQNGTINASYATGNADGGDGVSDRAGGLIGNLIGQTTATIVASYGFGERIGEIAGIDGTERPVGVSSAMDLTAENAGNSWNSASSGTLGAWDFGDSSQPPALVFNDYDGDSAGTDYAALFGKVTKLGALLPNQRLETSPQIGTATTDIQLNSGDTANRISGNIQLPATFNGKNLTWSVFYDPAPSSTQISIDNNNSVQITSTHRQTNRIVILRARDSGNNTIVNDYHLRIIAANRIDPPALTAPSSPLLFAIGTTVSRTIVGSDGRPDSCSIAGLPAGLTATVSGDGCVITGSATTITALSTYTLTASNAVGSTTISFTLATIDPPTLTTPSNLLVFAVDTTITRIIAGNNGTPAHCAVAGLPTGLSASVLSNGCAISGRATTITALSTYTLTASNNDGIATITISIVIKTSVDRNANGLIELYTLTQLHNMRYSLDGSRYKTSSTDTGSTLGCPNDACIGYELMNDLDFDTDGDGTWTQDGSGNYSLNTNDSATPYFIVNADGTGGWLPVGDTTNAFNAIFEGNSYAIHNLAIRGELNNISLFGVTTANASIRNIGLVNNLSNYTGSDQSVIGGLVGIQNGGSISASYATGIADGGSGLEDVGGLVGIQNNGSISASYATGNVNGGRRQGNTGGLVGNQNGGNISASYATGNVNGRLGGFDYTGGLVGFQNGGSIIASYATGDVDDDGGNFDYVGGLVGNQEGGSISASYATGNADGGDGDSDRAGGLVGSVESGGSVVASYATGNADGGDGVSDYASGLIGRRLFGGNVVASYGFGSNAGGEIGGLEGTERPVGVSSAMDLTAENADSAWNSASSGTLGAWDFGDSTQLPALVFNDYDGASTGTDYSVLFARLTTLTALIPNQRPTTSPQIGTANTDIQLSSGGDTANRIRGNIQLPATFNGENLAWSVLYDPAPSSTQISVDNNNSVQITNARQITRIVILRARDSGNNTIVNDYHLRIIAANRIDPPALTAPSSPLLFAIDTTVSRTVVSNSGTPDSCSVAGLPAGFTVTVSGDGCVITGLARTATAQSTYTLTASNAVGTDTITISIAVKTVVDEDANGLIELYTLTQLHNMRYSLDGSRYKTSSTDTGNALGCPNDTCIGYELMNDLDFDTDGDGTWTQDGSGTYSLNTNDSATPYFIVNADGTGGWLPVGDSANAFNTIFEGNGYAIYNLAIRSNHLANIGLFGVINANASIRNIGLVNNLSNYTGGGSSVIGGLVAQQNGGTISASYATGIADGSLGTVDIGGLVGSQEGGRIIASYATGDVNGGRRFSDTGGLVGSQNGGSIIASYATGDTHGGSGSNEYVGGLLGFQNGTISASYATGIADGNDGGFDSAGGLVGRLGNDRSVRRPRHSTSIASYATGNADGGDGDSDRAGGLVGNLRGQTTTTIVASYGFGERIGETDGFSFDGTEKPVGVSSATDLTAENAGNSWNSASSGTLGAWDFGDSSQPPALVFNDYDGDSTGTDYAALFGKVTKLGALLPNQRLETSPQIGTATTDIQLSSGDTANRISGNIQLPATFNGENLTWSVFYDPAPSVAQISVDNNNVVQINASHRNITRIIILRARGDNNNTIVNDYHLRIIAE